MRTQSCRLAPSDSAINFMLRNACRIRASSPWTSVLVLGSMPRIPATKTKSPARAPTSHVPVLLIAPSGASVFTPLGEGIGRVPPLHLRSEPPQPREPFSACLPVHVDDGAALRRGSMVKTDWQRALGTRRRIAGLTSGTAKRQLAKAHLRHAPRRRRPCRPIHTSFWE